MAVVVSPGDSSEAAAEGIGRSVMAELRSSDVGKICHPSKRAVGIFEEWFSKAVPTRFFLIDSALFLPFFSLGPMLGSD